MDFSKKAIMNDWFYNQFAEKVAEQDRLGFLPDKFDDLSGLKFFERGGYFERCLYSFASKMDDSYNGGYWDFAQCHADTKAFFMHLSSQKTFTISNLNYPQEYVVDGRIFGLIACLMVFSHASFYFYEKDNSEMAGLYSNMYHKTRDAFYSLADEVLYPDEVQTNSTLSDGKFADQLSDEQKQQIKQMTSIVTRYLD